MPRRHRLIAAICLAAGPAAADRTTTSVTASGDVSATDNVFAAQPEQRESDVSFAIRPGVLFGYDGPRASHELALEGEILEFVRHSDDPSVSLRGSARTRIQATRFTSLAAQLEGASGVVTALAARSSPDVTGPQLVPLGRVDTLSGGGSVGLAWEASRSLQITPSLFGRVSRSDDNLVDADGADAATITNSAEAGGQIAFERTWRGDALALEAPVTAMLARRLDRQLNPRLRAQWRHDLGPQWSSTLDGGVVYVHPFGTDPANPDAVLEDGVFPVFGGGLAYTEVWGRAQLQARREVAPNLLVAQNTVNDTATVQLALPLPWLDDRRRQPKLVALGSIGVARTQLVDSASSDTESEFYVGNLDLGIGYSPRPGFTCGLRYQLQYQTGNDAGELLIPGFRRNTVSFTFNVRYPDQSNGEPARRRSRGVRADGGDLVPIGVDPVTTDAAPGDAQGGGSDE